MIIDWENGIEAKRSLEADIERWSAEIERLGTHAVYSLPYKIRQAAAMRSCVANAKRELLHYRKFEKGPSRT